MATVIVAISFAFLVYSFTVVKGQEVTITKCDYDQRCGCHTDKGYIDLNPLTQSEPYKVLGRDLKYYYWLPCNDFILYKKTVGCLQWVDNKNIFDCGIHKKASSKVENGKAVFLMTSDNVKRYSKVTCVCDTKFSFQFIDEKPEAHYNFQVKAKACCPVPESSAASEGISAGSVLLIVFFSAIFIYVVAGVAIQVGVRKSEGMERIPNVTFWSALPGLIMDGFRFTFSCGRSSGYSEVK